MTPNVQQKPELITPAEMQFWLAWADKAPGLIRAKIGALADQASAGLLPYKIGSVGLGAALGIASFTKAVPGRWKWATGLGSAASFAVTAVASMAHSEAQKMQAVFLNYADALEKDPVQRQQLAGFMSASVTADMAAHGMEEVVLERVATLVTQLPRLQQCMPSGGVACR